MTPSRALARPTTVTPAPYLAASLAACESSARRSHWPTIPKPTTHTRARFAGGTSISRLSGIFAGGRGVAKVADDLGEDVGTERVRRVERHPGHHVAVAAQ